MGAISDTLPEQRSKEGALGKPVRCVTWARLIANVAVALALISCIGLLLYEDTSVAMIVQFSSGHRGGTVMRSQIQTARRPAAESIYPLNSQTALRAHIIQQASDHLRQANGCCSLRSTR